MFTLERIIVIVFVSSLLRIEFFSLWDSFLFRERCALILRGFVVLVERGRELGFIFEGVEFLSSKSRFSLVRIEFFLLVLLLKELSFVRLRKFGFWSWGFSYLFLTRGRESWFFHEKVECLSRESAFHCILKEFSYFHQFSWKRWVFLLESWVFSSFEIVCFLLCFWWRRIFLL